MRRNGSNNTLSQNLFSFDGLNTPLSTKSPKGVPAPATRENSWNRGLPTDDQLRRSQVSGAWVREKKNTTYAIVRSPIRRRTGRPKTALPGFRRPSSKRSVVRPSTAQENVTRQSENARSKRNSPSSRRHERLGHDGKPLTNRQEVAFTGSAALGDHHEGRAVTEETIQQVRSKLRAASYIGVRGENLRREFERIDTNCDGLLSREELAHALKRMIPISEDDIDCLMRIFTREGKDGLIDFNHFVGFMKGESASEEIVKSKIRNEDGFYDLHRELNQAIRTVLFLSKTRRSSDNSETVARAREQLRKLEVKLEETKSRVTASEYSLRKELVQSAEQELSLIVSMGRLSVATASPSEHSRFVVVHRTQDDPSSTKCDAKTSASAAIDETLKVSESETKIDALLANEGEANKDDDNDNDDDDSGRFSFISGSESSYDPWGSVRASEEDSGQEDPEAADDAVDPAVLKQFLSLRKEYLANLDRISHMNEIEDSEETVERKDSTEEISTRTPDPPSLSSVATEEIEPNEQIAIRRRKFRRRGSKIPEEDAQPLPSAPADSPLRLTDASVVDCPETDDTDIPSPPAAVAIDTAPGTASSSIFERLRSPVHQHRKFDGAKAYEREKAEREKKLRAYKFRARDPPKSTMEPRLEMIREKQRRRRERVVRKRAEELNASRHAFSGIEERYRRSMERWNKKTAAEKKRQEELRKETMFRAKPAPNFRNTRSYGEIARRQEQRRQKERESRIREQMKRSRMPRRMEAAFARDAASCAAAAALAAARAAKKRSARVKNPSERTRGMRSLESKIPDFERLQKRWEAKLKSARASKTVTRPQTFSFSGPAGRHVKARRMREMRKQKERDEMERRRLDASRRYTRMRRRARSKANKAAVLAEREQKRRDQETKRKMMQYDREREEAIEKGGR